MTKGRGYFNRTLIVVAFDYIEPAEKNNKILYLPTDRPADRHKHSYSSFATNKTKTQAE